MGEFTENSHRAEVSDFRATAIAYAAIHQVSTALSRISAIEIGDYDREAFDGRLDIAKRICSQYSGIGLGAAADPECRLFRIGFMSPARKRGDDKPTGIAAVLDIWRLDDGNPDDPAEGVERRVVAIADVHVLQRLAKRAGKVSLESFGDALMPAWGWAGVADTIDVNGAYMIPVEDGMLYSERIQAADDRKTWKNIVKTFIGHEDMNEANMTSWRYLRDSGCIRATPAFPRVEEASRREEAMMFQMKAEGGAWEYRRAHARRLAGEDPGQTPELSLF